MTIGKRIKSRRVNMNLTQKQLATLLLVSEKTVSMWENEEAMPSNQNKEKLSIVLDIPLDKLGKGDFDVPCWDVKDRIFSEENMLAKLRKIAKEEKLQEFPMAIGYALVKHSKELRDGNKFHKDVKVPYIIHPLMMACHAHALGIHDDKVLSVIMLHDICENCGILPEDLPFSDEIKYSVFLLTKENTLSTQDYYREIESDSIASIVKALDRCNNVSTMAMSFDRKRLIKYVNETEEYVYPLLNHIKHEYPQYNDAVFVIKYQLLSLIETVKSLLLS